MSLTLERLSPWLFTIGLFVLWELACRIFKVDTFVLPAPSLIFVAVAQYWLPLAKNSFVTLWTTLAGFALAARRLGQGADPYRLAALGVLAGLAAFSAVIFAAPLRSPP